MQEMTMDEVEQVSGAIMSIDQMLGDVGKGALAGGFAGFFVTGGNPMGFIGGAVVGGVAGAIYYYW